MRYSVELRDRIFVKGYGFLPFAKNMGKNTGKQINKNLSGKYSEKLLDHAEQSATDVRKITSKKVIQKTAEILIIWLVIKLLIEFGKPQEVRRRIIQKQL